VASRGYSTERLEAAIEALSEDGRLREAEAIVASSAPALQRLLAGALAAGGWFDEAHGGQVERAAGVEPLEERLTAIGTLIAEETRMAMMVGVAVGWTLHDELGTDLDDQAQQED
jgi:anti-sigma factor RsiW